MTAHVSKPQKSSGFKWIVPEPFAFPARPGDAGSGYVIGALHTKGCGIFVNVTEAVPVAEQHYTSASLKP